MTPNSKVTYHCEECGNEVEESCEDRPKATVISLAHTLTDAERAEIVAAAKATAQMFADEFPGEVLDPAKTDWDATAWQEDRSQLSFRDRIDGDVGLQEQGWELYGTTLVAETARLAE